MNELWGYICMLIQIGITQTTERIAFKRNRCLSAVVALKAVIQGVKVESDRLRQKHKCKDCNTISARFFHEAKIHHYYVMIYTFMQTVARLPVFFFDLANYLFQYFCELVRLFYHRVVPCGIDIVDLKANSACI